MKEKPNIDCEKYRQIAQMAKMGWWESDLKNRQYICSDFIIDLLGSGWLTRDNARCR